MTSTHYSAKVMERGELFSTTVPCPRRKVACFTSVDNGATQLLLHLVRRQNPQTVDHFRMAVQFCFTFGCTQWYPMEPNCHPLQKLEPWWQSKKHPSGHDYSVQMVEQRYPNWNQGGSPKKHLSGHYHPVQIGDRARVSKLEQRVTDKKAFVRA